MIVSWSCGQLVSFCQFWVLRTPSCRDCRDLRGSTVDRQVSVATTALAQTARSSPYESTGLGYLLIPWADPGPDRAGPGWELTGLALARTNPIVPRVARTNPAWDQSGLAIWVMCDDRGKSQQYGCYQVSELSKIGVS